MKSIVFAAVLAAFSFGAFAQDACTKTADEKKLAGAARNSFVKKCVGDSAKAACDASAAEKKLAGAAKNSHIKKCVADKTAEATAKK